MRTLFLGLGSFAILGALLHTAQSQERITRTTVERSVVVPEDYTPFKVAIRDMVRLTGKGIAGAQIRVKIDGPARLVATNRILPRRNGHPVIGLNTTEFEMRPTGKGKVKARITSTPPIPGEKPTVETYEFDVD
jgi:hypothetical protein